LSLESPPYPIVERDNDQWLLRIGCKGSSIEAPRTSQHEATLG
jgi:hypothetical protein